MDRTENRNEQTVPGDAGNEQKEMSTHIHFEISGGEYSGAAEEKRTAGSKALGVVKGVALGVGFAAKTALTIGLALRVAKGLKKDDEWR